MTAKARKLARLMEAAGTVVVECELQFNVGTHDGADHYYELGQETLSELRGAYDAFRKETR